LVWGFIGTNYARFSSFITTPKQALNYLKEELSGDAKRYIGHNPAGAIMIFTLIISLLLTGFTGMATIATEGKGPLADTFIASYSGETLGEVHVFFTTVVLILVILHVGGVIFSSLAEEENLVKAMLTGKKRKE
jgi:cytochrome b